MLRYFSVRFVIATFGGAAVGLLVGLLAVHVFGANWNPFILMPFGIMAGAMAVGTSRRRSEQSRAKSR